VAVLLVVLLGVGLVALVAWPLLARSGAGDGSVASPADIERQRVEEDLDRALTAIREIEFDHRAGNLSDEDFAALDREERARAVELIRRRDALTEPGSPQGEPG
jgi:hypothetical protein